MSNWHGLVEDKERIHKKEREWVRRRRVKAGLDPKSLEHDSVGLALSGGGIRSATFNLGLIQGLHKYGFLKYVDYLSTVSGGGYIGACLTWLKIKGGGNFPFGKSRKDYSQEGGEVLAWLRCHSQYLTPGDGLNIWSFIAACITGVFINLLIVIPVFLGIFLLLTRDFFKCNLELPSFLSVLKPFMSTMDGFFFIFCISIFSFLLYVVIAFAYVISTRCRNLCHEVVQRWFRVWMGIWFMIGVITFVVGIIPIVYSQLGSLWGAEWVQTAISGISVTGVISFMIGFIGRKNQNETQGARSWLLSIGLTLLVYGLFLYFYHLTSPLILNDPASRSGLLAIAVGLVVSVFLALVANINHVSMHRFYRNRLREAYMPYDVTSSSGMIQSGTSCQPGAVCHYPCATPQEADFFYFKDMQDVDTDSPYPLINTNLQTVGSGKTKLRRRGGENFVFSPYYCGSDSTRWIQTEEYAGGESNLATAMAISGAAVDPNTYATRSRPLSFLMTLFNVRLGYWARNPKYSNTCNLPLRAPAWYYYIFREMLGAGLSENCRQIHLSDGGHFENLGVYELVRRKCKYILASDAGCDPQYQFSDLAKLIELIRVDFGTELNICTNPLRPDAKTGLSQVPFIIGTLEYNDGSQGYLIYVKTTLINGLSEDIYGYRRQNSSFPDETTSDQFFDEQQFEAYRELGFLIGRGVLDGKTYNENTLEGLFENIKTRQERGTRL